MLETVVYPALALLLTSLITWFFTRKNERAKTGALEKNNDKSEIENYQLVAKEWREAAEQWKKLADEYQLQLIENSKKIGDLSKELSILKGLLTKANNRIKELEIHQK